MISTLLIVYSRVIHLFNHIQQYSTQSMSLVLVLDPKLYIHALMLLDLEFGALPYL